MPRLFGELDHLVFNGRAVSGTGAFNDPRVDRRAVYILTDDVVRLFIGIGQKTGYLLDLNICRVRGVGEGYYDLVSLLDRHLGIVQGPSVHSGRCACLESSERDPDPVQGILESCRPLHSARTRLRNGFSDKTARVQIGPRADDRRFAAIDCPRMDLHAGDFPILCKDLSDLRLPDRQVLLLFEDLPHGFGILCLIGLCPERMDRRPLGNIEHLGLDEGLVYIFTHLSAESIDLPDKVPLGRASYMRIAGHHRNAVDIHGEDHRLKSQPAAGKSRFHARMARADHADLCVDRVVHIIDSSNICFTVLIIILIIFVYYKCLVEC